VTECKCARHIESINRTSLFKDLCNVIVSTKVSFHSEFLLAHIFTVYFLKNHLISVFVTKRKWRASSRFSDQI